jgi:hypothetical protein
MAPKSSSVEEEYVSSFLQRSIITQIVNESSKKSNDNDKEGAASVAVEEGSSRYTFVSYEEYCRAKRKRNEQFLAEALQVAQTLKQDATKRTPTKKKKKIVASSASLTADNNANTRRLTRSLNKRMQLQSGKEVNDQAASTVLDTVQTDDESKEDFTGTPRLYRKRRPRNHFLSQMETKPSLVLRKNASNHMLDVDWIAEMYSFLLKVPHGQGQSKKTVSHTNAERVMCKVRQLMSGDGISYHHWPDGKIFGKNLQINIMSTNFTHLLDEAIEFEETYGKDLGNGWLLRHPIEKLRLFQEYLLEKN